MTRMKESGIDWIGQIPQEWGVIKFKYLGDVKQGLTYSPSDIVDKDEGILVLRSGNIQNGILDFNNNVYVKTKVAESIVLRKNDILITARNGSPALIGKNAIIDTDITATFGAFMMVFRANKILFSKFAFYLMNVSFNFYRTFFTTSTVNQLTAAIFNGIEVPLPSISEQQKIADFLDKKTAQLDKVKALLEEQILKLKDYRASLIYETVTKGLDKTVPMKDSGIDWIGQVPQEWRVKPLKYLIEFKNGYAFDSQNLTIEQTGVKVIRIGDFKLSGIDFNAALNVFTSLNSKLDFYRIRKSQILIAMSGATVGKISFVNQEPNVYSVINQRVGIIESKISKWIYYCLSTDSFTSYIQLNSNGSAQPNISSGEISDFKVAIPNDVVIQKCVKYLDNQFENINKLIQNKKKQIDNINKLRQTLIYDYVTGKRRV